MGGWRWGVFARAQLKVWSVGVGGGFCMDCWSMYDSVLLVGHAQSYEFLLGNRWNHSI